MKILRIIARLNIGGPARNAALLTQGLREKGFETVLACGKVNAGEGDMSYLLEGSGVSFVVIDELARELTAVNDWKAFWKIYRLICKEKPDVVHTHTAKAGTLGRLAAVVYNITHAQCKIVHTFHGHVLRSYFGKGKTLFFIWIERILALWTDKIIAVSGSLKNELVENFRIAPRKKFSVVELGFDLDMLLKLPERKETDCLNIGIIGRLVPVKNHRMLFRVCLKLKALCSRAKVVIIGDGELRSEFENYVEGLGIRDIIEFKGWVKSLSYIYEDLDIVVLTSLNEGTPVSIIEAMAAAKPVVATNVGGVPDIVENGKSGYLVESNNDTVFADRLLDLINDRDKRIRFGLYGRELVKDRFSKNRLIDDMDRLYNNLLKRGGKYFRR